MCLILNEIDGDKPYNDSKLRYKLVRIKEDGVYSQYVHSHKWTLGAWQEAAFVPEEVDVGDDTILNGHSVSKQEKDIGFHVIPDLESAMRLKNNHCPNLRIAEFEVEGFIASGMYYPSFFGDPEDDYKCETWKRAKLLRLI